MSTATEQEGHEFLSIVGKLSRSEHAGIGTVYESGTIDGQDFIALPTARGEPISVWRIRKDVTPKDFARVLGEVALALDELASVGLVPDYTQLESTLVDERGKPVLSPLVAAPNASQIGASKGHDDSHPHDTLPRDDVMAFGQWCYRLLKGAELPTATSFRLQREWREALVRELRSENSPLVNICLRALDDRPEHSYDTLAQLAEDLNAYARGRRKLQLPRFKHLLDKRIRLVLTVLVLAVVAWFGATGLYNATLQSPEQLISVKLNVVDGQSIQIAPVFSAGADVVNKFGMYPRYSPERDELAGVRTIEFECLSGTVAEIAVRTDDGRRNWLIPLCREDDDQSLLLRMDEACLWSNDRLLAIDFTQMEEPQTWTGSQLPSSPTEVPSTLRSVTIGVGDEYLPAVQWLGNSHVGLVVVGDHVDSDSPPSMSSELVAAISDVHSRQLALGSGTLSLLGSQNESLENLTLVDGIPECSGYPNLRFLTVVSNRGNDIDLSRIASCRNLLALNVMGEVRNVKAIRHLRRLQFLTLLDEQALLDGQADESSGSLHTIPRLRNLQYLAGVCHPNTDFSFTRRMPFLRTLCIVSPSPQSRLDGTLDASNLKCLAIMGAISNIEALKEAHPDVSFVEYDPGLCLGSIWLAILSAVVALLASLTRIFVRQHEGKPGWPGRSRQSNPRSTS